MKNTFLIITNLFSLVCFSQQEFVIQLNNINGTFHKIGPGISTMTFLYPDDRALDDSTGTYFFESADSTSNLYSIDISNDSTKSKPIVNHITAFQFDNIFQTLYGIKTNDTTNTKNLVSVNTSTGACTQISSSLPNSSMYSGSFSAYDNFHHVYIFLDPTDTLYSIDVSNGNIISKPYLTLLPGQNISNFVYDNSTNKFYGILQDNNLRQYVLAAIDLNTGICTPIGLGSGSTSNDNVYSSAIDEANQQYMYLYTNSSGYSIKTLDIATGNVLYDMQIESFPTQNNYYSLKYDNLHGNLYALHWEATSDLTTNITDHTSSNKINIYPNPFNQSATIKFNNSKNKEYILNVYNSNGKIVKTIQNIISDNITFEKDNLSRGFYYIKLYADQDVIFTDKVIIE